MRAAALLLFTIPSMPADAQTKRATPLSANVKMGTLASYDPDAATITLKPRSGADITYRLTEKTQILRVRKAVEASELKPGDSIVVRFRKSSVGPPTLYDLADRPSWDWLLRIRREITKITVKEIADDYLHAVEGADSAQIQYRITEKTSWFRGGKPASPEEFKAGSEAFVVPRLLPGGSVMAVAVSDTADGAAKLRERSRITVTGSVRTISAEKRALNLHTAAGDSRDIVIAEGCTVRLKSRDVPLSSIRAGQTVTVHLRRNEEGEQEATRITIQSSKSTRKPARPALPKRNPPAKPMAVIPGARGAAG